MTPFGGSLYFGILLYLAVPVALLGGLGVAPRRFLLLVSVAMVALQSTLNPGEDHWSRPAALGSLGAFILLQWVLARGLLRVRVRGKRAAVFAPFVLVALIPLAAVKFLPATGGDLLGFLGISYATFRALDVLFGIEDGLVTGLPLSSYVTYLIFFPTISAGPIDRYRRFLGDYHRPRSRPDFLADVDAAVPDFFRGILYSFVIVPVLRHYWLDPIPEGHDAWNTVSYMYGYSMDLFFDFAGYSAFAIAVGRVLGVRVPENFRRPFLSRNIVEFWDRWHITLSRWLRDHVYSRFVVAATRGKWFSHRETAGYCGSLLTFGLMGLWHGPEARYLAYGIYHGVLLVGYGILSSSRVTAAWKLPPWLAVLVTFHAVCFGFLIFSGRL